METNELRQIGPYQIRDVLGQGGMAVVYRAYQANLDREVAVKVITGAYTTDPSFVQRFQREARAIASLRHPNILTIHDFGQDAPTGQYYIVTELIEGKTLSSQLGQPLDPRWAARIISQVASALEYAHESGIVHRDVKPSNILMDRRDRAVLSDFGIAKLMQDVTNLTNTGGSIGTPSYMSPEQGLGDKVDGRSDQYSLGVVLYQMLTGTTPFRADTPVALLMAHVSRPLPDPRLYNPQLSLAIVNVLQRALAKNPGARFPTVGQFAQAFENAVFAGNTTVGARPDPNTLSTVPLMPPPGTNPGPLSPNSTNPPSGQYRPDQPMNVSNGGPSYTPGGYLPAHQPLSDVRPVAQKRSWLPLALGGLLLLIAVVVLALVLLRPGSSSSDQPAATAVAANATPTAPGSPATNTANTITASASTAATSATISSGQAGGGCPVLSPLSPQTAEAGQGLIRLSVYETACKSALGDNVNVKVFKQGDHNTLVTQDCCRNALDLKVAPGTYDLDIAYTSNVHVNITGVQVTTGQTTTQTAILKVGQLNFDFLETQGKSAIGDKINLKIYKQGDHNTEIAQDCCRNKLTLVLPAGVYDAVVGYSNGLTREVDGLDLKEGQNLDQTINFEIGHFAIQVMEGQSKTAQDDSVAVKIYKQEDTNTIITQDCCRNKLDFVLPPGTYQAEVGYANSVKVMSQNFEIKAGQTTSQTVNLGVGRVNLDITEASGNPIKADTLSVKVYKQGDRNTVITQDCCRAKYNLVLPPGTYEIEVTYTNDRKTVGPPIEIKEGQTVAQTIKV